MDACLHESWKFAQDKDHILLFVFPPALSCVCGKVEFMVLTKYFSLFESSGPLVGLYFLAPYG